MFTTQEIIGDIVFISFNDHKRYLDIGIDCNCGHFMILGYDSIGVWVSHPNLILTTTNDESGRTLPENEITKEKIDSNFLITWDNIKTLMHYPDRKGFDFPSEFDKKFGFKIDKK